MIKNNPSFKFAIIISILLHIIVLSFLFVHISRPQKLAENPAAIVNAVVVNNSPSHPTKIATAPIKKPLQIEKIEQKALKQHKIEEPKPENTERAQPKIVEKTPPVAEEPALDQPDLKKEILEMQKKALAEKKLQEQKMAAAKKAKERKKMADLAKKRREEEAKKLQKELALEEKVSKESDEAEDEDKTDSEEELVEKEETAKNLENDLAQEEQQLNSMKAQASQGEIDKYKLKIIQSISQKWIIPEALDQQISCQLLVHLGPGGVVVNVDMIKESGDATLDRSARTAVMKASPLPVPESELFDKFRSLRLTFRPQGVTAG